MRARLKTDVLCGTQAYRLEAGTEVDAEDTTEGEFRDRLRRYTIIKPAKLVCRVTFNELEFIE